MNEGTKRQILAAPASIIATSLVYPLDTIKVRWQSNNYMSFFKTVQKFGLLNYYKGLSPALLQNVGKYSIRFTVFEKLKGDNFFRNVGAGAAAGTIESIIITPFEVLKTNLQVTKSKNPFVLFKESGFRSLYRGFGPTCFRQSINQASLFSTYTIIRNKIIKENESPPTIKIMAAAAVSGIIGPILNNPFDVIKTRFMNPKYNYESMFKAGKEIIKEEGISKLYSAMPVRLTRVACAQAIVFSVIENILFFWK